MIHPNQKYKQLWDVFVMAANTYAVLEIPFRIAVDIELTGWALIFDHILTSIFFADIILNFLTGIQKGRRYISDQKAVSKHYLKTWFIIDFVATVPFDLILASLFSFRLDTLRFLRFTRLMRMLRVARLLDFVKKKQDPRTLNLPLLRLIFFIFWILLFSHWIACGWLLLSEPMKPSEEWTRYVKSLYWTITTLTTVGYGDVTPETIPQTIYSMFVMILGVGVYGYVIGNVAGLLRNIDVAKTHHLKRMGSLNAFFKFRNIPVKLQGKILDYYTYLWDSRLGYDEDIVLEHLPNSLRIEISLFLNRGIIEKVPLFQATSDDFIREIANELKPVIFTPGDYIIKKDEVGDMMYFISRGSVEIVSDDGKKVLDTLHEGDFFGEMSLLLSMPRTANIRAVEYCDIYTLDKESLQHAIDHHPEFKKQLDDIAQERLKGNK